MKKKWDVIEVPKTGIKNWFGGAFTYAFVYSNRGNFLVKGYKKEVEEFLKTHFSRYFVRYVLYNRGEHREIMEFGKNCHLYLGEPSDMFHRHKRHRYEVMPKNYDTNLNSIKLTFKRLPKKWIPEFDYLIDQFTKKNDSDNRYFE
jgi:hypothetical protein